MPSDIEALLARALSLHQAGSLNQAHELYRQILAIRPDHDEATHLMGALALQQGEPVAAEQWIAKAIAINPGVPIYYGNRANALRQLDRLDEAIACLEAGLKLHPDFAELHYNHGILLADAKRHAEAVAAFRHATRLNPGHPQAFYNCGNALMQLEDHAAAVACYEAAIALRPGYAKAYYNLGKAWRASNDDEMAVRCFSRAIGIDPGYAKAYYNRGNALQALKRHDEAVKDYDQCIALQPDDDVALVNKGNALLSQNDYASAVEAYDRAIEVNPDVAAYHNNKGNAFLGLKRHDQALGAYEQAVQVDPLEKDAHFNQAICYLLTGDLRRGFQKYEWRWKTEDMAKLKPQFSQPAWTGQEAIAGKRVLLYCEQGLGDTIQFVRYARRVAGLGARVVLVVQPPLLELMKRLDGEGELVADGSPIPAFDYHCALLSLPRIFATELASIPAHERYFFPEEAKVAAWEKKLGNKTRPRLGLVWSGRPEHKNDSNRSLGLADFLRAIPQGFDLVCLQKELRPQDRDTLSSRPDIRFFGDELKDFSDTAALCESMDLVVSVDTSVAHLAGAIGKPVWILLPFVPDWRWLLDRDDTPWYPSARLFRQPAAGDWPGALAQVHQALLHRLGGARVGAGNVTVARKAGSEDGFTTEAGRLPVLLNWQLGSTFGWGLLGLNIFMHWARDPKLQPLMGHRIGAGDVRLLDPLRLQAISHVIDRSNDFVKQFLGRQGGMKFSFPLIDALGNGLVPRNNWVGSETIGRCIFEDTQLEKLDRKLAKFDWLLTASNWNRALLESSQTKPVHVVLEGIDHALFFPGPRSGLLSPNRFYIFSGGKIEYRKAQDLVLRAFREFAARHDDAVLVTSWQSPFAVNSVGFRGTLASEVKLAPDGRQLDIQGWAEDNGISRSQVLDIGMVPNQMMPAVLREMDCAMQVSRAEACTNLPAKEAMACGVPVILAQNTGVLDLIDVGNCLPLTDQRPVSPQLAGCGVDGWGECGVEAMVDALERLYSDTQLRRSIGQRGAEWILANGRTWQAHSAQLKRLLLENDGR